MNSKLIQILTTEIKSKNQIKNLDNSYIVNKLNKFFLTNGNYRKKLEMEFEVKQDKIMKSKIFKEVIKLIRQEIGQVYGQFLTSDLKKKDKFLSKINSIEEINTLLKLHKSSRERIEHYNEIYLNIFNWYQPKQIADLACGYNPLSYFILKDILEKDMNYFASDLNPEDMEFINSFFNKFSIKGIAKNYDILEFNFLKDKDFLKSDLVFMFKALDSFEEIKKNFSKELLEKLPQKYIVVSFPTKSLVAKEKFKNKEKGWLRKIIEENNWNYEIFEIENEIFFLISKD